MKTDEKSNISKGCRPKSAVSDTVDHPWSKENRIRWVEWRVRELTIEEGQYIDERGKWLLEEKAAGGRKLMWGDQVADYAVWLLKERDGLSWHQIAYRFFPSATEAEIEKYESKVRRAYARVERHHDGSKNFKASPLSKDETQLLETLMLGVKVIPIEIATPEPQCPSRNESGPDRSKT
jgi:hypothetical protein